jgi:hypothetical protein
VHALPQRPRTVEEVEKELKLIKRSLAFNEVELERINKKMKDTLQEKPLDRPRFDRLQRLHIRTWGPVEAQRLAITQKRAELEEMRRIRGNFENKVN